MTKPDFTIIKNQTFTLIGEMHGVRENLNVLKQLVQFKLHSKLPILLAFEWPKELEREVGLYIKGEADELVWQNWDFVKNGDGRFSKEHLTFLSWLRETNSLLSNDKKIRLTCFDVSAKNWNTRDRRMAKHLLSVVKKRKQVVLVIMGNLHSRNKIFFIDKTKYIPLGSYLPRRQTVGVRLVYLSGSFYNLGLKKFDMSKEIKKLKIFEIKKAESKSGHDYVLHIKEAHATKLL